MPRIQRTGGEEAENRRVRLAAELLASPTYASTAARVRAFVEQGGGCRATFFNYTIVGLVLPSVRITGGMHSTRGFEWSILHCFSGGRRTLPVVFGAYPHLLRAARMARDR